MTYEAPFPHCDDKVLHAPGECVFCDEFQDAQQARIHNNINFTGHNDPGKTECPAEQRRSLQKINKWYGNVPRDTNE